MEQMTYQVEMGPDTHNQLEKPGLTYRTRDEAVRSIGTVLKAHGRQFTIEIDGDAISFLSETDSRLAVIRPVRANPTQR